MASGSSIEWTESTWNPVTGCTKASPGCAHCYAERMTRRLTAMGLANYKDGFELRMHPHVLELPLRWKKSQTIFVNSMSDLFHKDVTRDFVMKVFDVMSQAHWHTFQVLTKRAERLAALQAELPWSDNIWMGVSVESKDYKRRIDFLRNTKARVKFISFEPLLGDIGEVDLHGIDWAIVGGVTDKIYLSGVAGSDNGYVGVASGYATGSSAQFFTFKASDGGFDWFCLPIFGTWVAS